MFAEPQHVVLGMPSVLCVWYEIKHYNLCRLRYKFSCVNTVKFRIHMYMPFLVVFYFVYV
jgi:hypothetical protein